MTSDTSVEKSSIYRLTLPSNRDADTVCGEPPQPNDGLTVTREAVSIWRDPPVSTGDAQENRCGERNDGILLSAGRRTFDVRPQRRSLR